MTKQQKIKKYFTQADKLTMKNQWYRRHALQLLERLIAQDLDARGDITTNLLISRDQTITACIKTRHAGILAGGEETIALLGKHRISATAVKKDGSSISKNETVMRLTGRARDILTYERIALNVLQRMSGIATATHSIIQKNRLKALLCPTRKTVWGMLDKKAVAVGGGGTHRLGLSDFILIKENHLALIPQPLFEKKLSHFWEIEVEDEKQALAFSSLNPDALMFDNFTPRRITSLLPQLPAHIIFEASGGITEKNISAFDQTGVDVISMGALTHSSHSLDMGLDICID